MNQVVGKRKDGKPFMALILEPGNLHKLREGKPIAVQIEDLFPNGIPKRLELMISFNEVPLATTAALSQYAEVTIDERSATGPTRPHCPECRSTIEQLGVWRNDTPMALTFCASCGCVFGVVPGDVARTLSASK